MTKKKRSLLKKYQLGTVPVKEPDFQTWESSAPSIPSQGYVTGPNGTVESTSSYAPGMENSAVGRGLLSFGQGTDPNVGSGVAGGLGAIAGGLGAGAAAMRANTRSEIDPRSIYAYDPSKSGFQGHKRSASTTAAILGAAGGIASSTGNPIGQIIGAGLGVGAAGTEMGLADLEQRLIRAHDAKYRQRMNVGGSQGDFTTQGQFVTREEPGRNNSMELKKGGYIKQYAGGGMAITKGVPRKYANAELEGGEIVERPVGPDVYVKGPSHEKGGVPMKLQEGGPAKGGDYVWSDHLTYKGKTMAELYAMAVQNNATEEQIEQLRMLQEQLAGRAGDPQDAKELEEIPMAKKGGMLKKYQTGTPYANLLPEATVSAMYPYTLKPKEEIGDYVLPEEDSENVYEKEKESSSKKGTQAYGKRSAGEKALELLPYGAAGVGAIAQLATTLGSKNPYKDVKAPKANLVSTPEKQFFERTDSRAQEAANQRGASLSKQLLQQAGFGPAEIAAMQKVELDRAAADAQATQQAREFNIQQDRAEKQLNTEMKLSVDMANQSVANEAARLEYERKLNEAGFETERTQSIGDVVSGTMLDVGKFASDANYARAIEGGTGAGRRAWNYDPYKARVQIKMDNPQKDGESNTDYELRINQLQNKYAAEFFKNK